MLDFLEKFYHPSLVLKHTEKSFFNIIDKLAQKRGVHTSARISTYLIHCLKIYYQHDLKIHLPNLSLNYVSKFPII